MADCQKLVKMEPTEQINSTTDLNGLSAPEEK